MTEFRFERKKEVVDDYIKSSLFTNNLPHKILIIALGICLLAVAVMGIVLYIVTGIFTALIMTIVAVILAVAYPLFLFFFIKNLAKKLSTENPDEKDVTIGVSENDILLIRNNVPCGVIEWSDITEIFEGKTGFFLTEKGGALIMLGKSSLHSGSYDEAKEILDKKKAALK